MLAEQQLLNQLSYVEEYMSKSLRAAKSELNENCLIDSQGADHQGYIYLLTRYGSMAGQPDAFGGVKFINSLGVKDSGDAVCQNVPFFVMLYESLNGESGSGFWGSDNRLYILSGNVAVTPEMRKMIEIPDKFRYVTVVSGVNIHW